jgi:hypothetical protein
MAESDEAKDNVTVLDGLRLYCRFTATDLWEARRRLKGLGGPTAERRAELRLIRGKKLVGLYRPHQHKRLWIRADP